MTIPNRLLAAIPPNEYARLRPRLEEVGLRFGTNIYNAGGAIGDVYFPYSGIISHLAVVDSDSTIEVGMTGREGMVGISALMGVTISGGRAVVSAPGTAMKLSTSDLENRTRRLRRFSTCHAAIRSFDAGAGLPFSGMLSLSQGRKPTCPITIDGERPHRFRQAGDDAGVHFKDARCASRSSHRCI